MWNEKFILRTIVNKFIEIEQFPSNNSKFDLFIFSTIALHYSDYGCSLLKDCIQRISRFIRFYSKDTKHFPKIFSVQLIFYEKYSRWDKAFSITQFFVGFQYKQLNRRNILMWNWKWSDIFKKRYLSWIVFTKRKKFRVALFIIFFQIPVTGRD